MSEDEVVERVTVNLEPDHDFCEQCGDCLTCDVPHECWNYEGDEA